MHSCALVIKGAVAQPALRDRCLTPGNGVGDGLGKDPASLQSLGMGGACHQGAVVRRRREVRSSAASSRLPSHMSAVRQCSSSLGTLAAACNLPPRNACRSHPCCRPRCSKAYPPMEVARLCSKALAFTCREVQRGRGFRGRVGHPAEAGQCNARSTPHSIGKRRVARAPGQPAHRMTKVAGAGYCRAAHSLACTLQFVASVEQQSVGTASQLSSPRRSPQQSLCWPQRSRSQRPQRRCPSWPRSPPAAGAGGRAGIGSKRGRVRLH